MTDYPCPSHACMMWIAGDQLMVRFPPSDGHTAHHVVSFEADERGIASLTSVLRARAKQAHYARGIGHSGTPTQADANRLRAMANAIKMTTVVKTTVKPVSDREAKRMARLEREAELASLIHDLDFELEELS